MTEKLTEPTQEDLDQIDAIRVLIRMGHMKLDKEFDAWADKMRKKYTKEVMTKLAERARGEHDTIL